MRPADRPAWTWWRPVWREWRPASPAWCSVRGSPCIDVRERAGVPPAATLRRTRLGRLPGPLCEAAGPVRLPAARAPAREEHPVHDPVRRPPAAAPARHAMGGRASSGRPGRQPGFRRACPSTHRTGSSPARAILRRIHVLPPGAGRRAYRVPACVAVSEEGIRIGSHTRVRPTGVDQDAVGRTGRRGLPLVG